MKTARLTLALATAGLLCAVPGCAREDAPTVATPPTPARMPAAKKAAAKPEQAKPQTQAASYTPPYPQRENLFSPPKRADSGARRRSSSQDDAVELLGFVSVDQPKAVLSIDGVVTSLAAGGEKYGIQVISIEPPKVILQRGRNRWTASLD